MSTRTELSLAVASLVAVCLFIGFYEPVAAPSHEGSTSTLKPIPSRTVSIVPNLLPNLLTPTSTYESLLPRVETGTTTIQKRTFPKFVIVPPKPAVPVAPVAPAPKATTTPATPSPARQAAPQNTLTGTIVNILCISHKSPLRGTSGTGVFIDSEGVILTVAHVAQAVLLSEELGDSILSCTIRTGSPARSVYKARVLYISEAWLRKNPTTLISSQPMGTGENDIALLAVIASTNGAALPSLFPALALSNKELAVGDTVRLGGYGAQYLTTSEVKTSLTPTFSTGTVTDLYTLHTNTQDVVGILGGRVAQEGSSGGPAVDETGKLAGIIATSEINGDFASRHVRILTPLHIRTSFESDTGESLSSYLGGASVSTRLSSYKPKASELGAFLAHAIGME